MFNLHILFSYIGFCIVQRPRQSDQLISVNNARRVRISIHYFTRSLKLLNTVNNNIMCGICFCSQIRSIHWMTPNAVNYVFVRIHWY